MASPGRKSGGEDIEEEYNEDFDAGAQSLSNNLEKPIDLGKGGASKKNADSILEEEIVTEHDKSNLSAPISEAPTS